LSEEKKRTWDVTCDMTRQYKSMQQEKDDRVRTLEHQIDHHRAIIEQRDAQIVEVHKEREARLREKDEEIRELKRKIDEMSQRFANMLKETLDQMKEKIEMVNKNWDEEMEIPALKKLEDYATS
jgi:chromosome segregation ATPase